MKDLLRFQVNPNPVPANGCFTLIFPPLQFPADMYQITDEEGRLIRRGRITERDRELALSSGGMQDGVYWIIVGENRERFTIL